MGSGTIYFKESSTSGNYITGKITWSSSTNKDANTSDVTVNLYVAKGHWDMMLTVPTTGTWGYKLTINGTSYSGYKSYLSVLEEWVLIYSQTVTGIKHDEGGGKSISLYGSVTAPSGTTLAGHTASGSGTATFETIPRASTIDSLKCSTAYLDGTITAVYAPKNAAYFNKQIVYLNYNGVLTALRTTNIGRNTAAQQSSIINLTSSELSKIYAKVTSATSAKLRVSFFTYSDSAYSVKIGDTQYKEITLTIPTGVKPKASLSASMLNDNAWIKSKGIYVAGFSKTKLTLSAEAGEGASVSSTSISGEGFSQAVTTVTAALAAAGRFTFTGKVTDTRGRSASDDAEITVLPYSPPIISALKVERGTYSSGWTASENGPDVRCYFITSLGLADQGNTYDVTFALDGAAQAPDVGIPEGLRSGIDYALHFYDVDSELSHTLTVSVTDLTGTSRSAAIVIPTKNAAIEFKANGKGIAFGKTSEKDAFECAMDAEFTGSVTIGGKPVDMVVEEGEQDFWSYRKWSSGLLECWGTSAAVTLSFDGSGNVYYGTIAPEFFFPKNSTGASMFVDIPTVQQTCKSGSAIIVSAISHLNSANMKLTYGRFYGGKDNQDVHFHFYARGKWK